MGRSLLSKFQNSRIGGAAQKTFQDILDTITTAVQKKQPVTLDTVKDMVRAIGREIPDEIEFVLGNPGEGNWASYAYNRGEKINWSSFFTKEEKIPVTVDPELLKYPGKAMQKLVHELHELEGLKAAFGSGESRTVAQTQKLIDYFHNQTEAVEKKAILAWGNLLKKK